MKRMFNASSSGLKIKHIENEFAGYLKLKKRIGFCYEHRKPLFR